MATYVNSSALVFESSASSIIIQRPSGTQLGDVLFSFISRTFTDDPSIVPSGWNLVCKASHNYASLYSKVITDSETEWTFYWTSAPSVINASCVAYRGVETTGIVADYSAADFEYNVSGTTLRGDSVTTGEDNSLVVFFGRITGNVAITGPSGFTERFDDFGDKTLWVADKEFSTAGATGTLDATFTPAANYKSSIVVALNNIPAIDVDPGVFSITGGSSSFVVNVPIETSSGSFSITGGDLNFDHISSYSLDTEGTSFSLSGEDASFDFDPSGILNISNGIFSISGEDLITVPLIDNVDSDNILTRAQENVIVSGSGFLNPQNIEKLEITENATYEDSETIVEQTLIDSWAENEIQFDLLLKDLDPYNFLYVDPGSFSLSSEDVSFIIDPSGILNISNGKFFISGENIRFDYGFSLDLGSSSFSLTGGDLTFDTIHSLDLGPSSFSIICGDLTFGRSISLDINQGSYSLEGKNIVFTVSNDSVYKTKRDNALFSIGTSTSKSFEFVPLSLS